MERFCAVSGQLGFIVCICLFGDGINIHLLLQCNCIYMYNAVVRHKSSITFKGNIKILQVYAKKMRSCWDLTDASFC